MRHRFRRGAAATAALLLLAAVAGCGEDDQGGTAGEASRTPPATALAAAGWLETQIGDTGLVHNDQYDIDDHGLSLDILFALHDLGTGEDSVAAILAALEKDPAAYTDAFGTESAGSTGKLATAVEVASDSDVTDFGGVDLVAKLEGLVVPGTGPQAGRGVDKGGADYSNTIGQSWVVRGLAGADSDLAEAAARFLLEQQCDEGFFRDVMTRVAPRDFSCDGAPATGQVGSVDATAFAVVALGDAAEAGVDAADAAQESAADWLEAEQAADGSFAAGGVPNSNSTAVAAVALAASGRDQAAELAAKWLAPLQVTEEGAEGTRLAVETGAVAYDAAAFTRAKKTGITVKQRDQWRRATAQAAPGLAAGSG
jgi:hypothetical protein